MRFGSVFSMEVVLGTYEEFLLGYRLQKLEVSSKKDKRYELYQSFTTHQHTGSIRCLAVQESGKLLVSGSTDETLQLYDLRKRIVTKALSRHEGTVTCVGFVKNTHLLSGSDDGQLLVWKTGSWMCEKTLSGHKGGVVSVAVHPSGALALSTGQDKALKTWNLTKGRTGFIVKLKGVGESLQFSPSGDFYSLINNGMVDIYSTKLAGVIYHVECKKKITASTFIGDTSIVVGVENGDMELHDLEAKECIWTSEQTHSGRIKAICSCPSTKNPDHTWMVSGSSDGAVKVWEIKDKLSKKTPKLLAEAETGCRVICMVLCSPSETKKENQECT